VGGQGLRAELFPQVVQFTLQRDHLLAQVHDSRGTRQVDAKVIDETPDPLHVLDILFRIEATAPGPHWLEEPPLFVPPQGPFVDAAPCRNDGDRVAWLVSRAVVNNPIGDGYAEYFGFPSLRHQDDRSCRIWRSS
jgi:hypothetical protein